jgi:cyanophycin synthetase
MAAINGEAFEVAVAVERVREKIDDCYLGPSTASIVGAATDRRIPHIRLNDGNLVQLGYGAAQRRIWTAETDLTSAIAEGIAGDKDLTKTLLKACGVPVPEGAVADDADAAWDEAQDIGLPVVVKPTDANHGRGVSLDLNTREEVMAAWAVADAEGSEVIVERYIRGDEHRLLVVGGQVVAAARGESLWITGDGFSSVTQLIDRQLNTDPRRGEAEEFPLETIRLEREPVIRLLLERQGLVGPDAVPAAGRAVLIQRNGNVAIDCTDVVHPDVASQVGLAARVVGLDIAGVDLVTSDIRRPLHETGGAIVEVNAGPGLLMHLKPAEGMPRPVGRDIVSHLFAEEASGRIPVVGVAGSQDTADIAQLVAWLVHLSGRHVGLACRDGLFLAGRRVGRGDCANWASGHRLLMNREVQTVVIENGAATILDDGLPYDRCHIGVVTDLGGAETLARHDIRDTEQMPRVLRTQVDVVLPEGAAVLNADDERIADMARLSDGDVILYSLQAIDNDTVAAHRGQGGRAVLLRASRVVLATGTVEVVCVDLQRRRIALAPSVVLAALAAGWALGIAPELMAAGLETFASSPTRS